MNSDDAKSSLVLGVVGLGHIGLPLALLLSLRGFKVIGFDVDKAHVEQLRQGKCQFYEKDLDQVFVKARATNRIEFTSDENRLSDVDVPIITVGTPWNDVEKKPDLSQLSKATELVGRRLKKGAVVILKSTVTPGTTETIVGKELERLSGLKVKQDFGLAFSPERIIEGRAIEDFTSLPKIVGGIDERSLEVASNIFGSLGGKVHRVSSLRAAEMVKLLDNYNRDSSIAVINNFALICEVAAVDVFEVIEAAKDDYPRNSGLLLPGAGVGGSCLNKDPWLLYDFAKEHRVHSELIPTLRDTNKSMPREVARLIKKVSERLQVDSPKVVIAGVAFKNGTDDIRYSPAIPLSEELSNLGYKFVLTDPYVETLNANGHAQEITRSVIEASKDANVIVFLSDHEEYKKIDLNALRRKMDQKAGIIDGRRVIDPREALKAGFDYEGIGRPREAFQ